jgi:hypothetical protein
VRKNIEEMMDLRCPRCRAVFGDFDGCAALTCGAAQCRAGFCALCLKDCGGDAHGHVRSCALNPKKNEYFIDKAVWRKIIDEQRRQQVICPRTCGRNAWVTDAMRESLADAMRG